MKEAPLAKKAGGAIILKMEVIFSNKDVIAINKPAAVLVHRTSAKRTGEETVADEIVKQFPEVRSVGDDPAMRPGIVHRLDKDTSGVLLVARNQEAFEYLKKLFQRREIKKEYLALVYGGVKTDGIIRKPIGLRPGTTKHSVNAKQMKMVKEAVTRYEVEEQFEKNEGKDIYTLLRVFPETGRTHQIRVHLASISHPVVGDALYGGKKERRKKGERLMLHARVLELTLPSGEKMHFEAEPPESFKEGLKRLHRIDKD